MLDWDSQKRKIIRGSENEKGWKNLELVEGDPIEGAPPSSAAKSILTLIHLSDLHICDAQSPARLEVLDRYADPHNPTSEFIKLVGNYRAQEILTTQTLDCMIDTLNQIEKSPISGRTVDGVVITGDVIDNAQKNELDWYLKILDGGEVYPNSGAADIWEGAASTSPETYDRSYWNPEGTPSGMKDDFPRALYGFPEIKGLMGAVTKRFLASGLKHRWFAIHGNHDAMLQGTVPADDFLKSFAIGNSRVQNIKSDADLSEIFSDYQMIGPARYPSTEVAILNQIAPDHRRDFIDSGDWISAHIECGHDHGLSEFNLQKKVKYWRKDIGRIALIALDSVNTNGGWQGSIDEAQFEWIKEQFRDLNVDYFVFLSHHPAETLFNDYEPDPSKRRICENELVDLLLTEPRVILWLSGHTHTHKIEERKSKVSKNMFWHIQTASNIDWPQQGRIVDIYQDGNRIVIATTVINHQGEIDLEKATKDLSSNLNLAGISRILSANDWQRRSGEFDLEKMAGSESDRNIYLWI